MHAEPEPCTKMVRHCVDFLLCYKKMLLFCYIANYDLIVIKLAF
jgi:hypothetical protein